MVSLGSLYTNVFIAIKKYACNLNYYFKVKFERLRKVRVNMRHIYYSIIIRSFTPFNF